MPDSEVAARVAIADLVARYNAQGDSGRFEAVLDLFADDAVMEIGDAGGGDHEIYEGKSAIESVFTGARDNLADQPSAGYLRHFTSTHQIDLTSETTATGRCYFSVLTSVGLDHWGRYIDDYRVDGDRWRFARRRVTVDDYAPQSFYL